MFIQASEGGEGAKIQLKLMTTNKNLPRGLRNRNPLNIRKGKRKGIESYALTLEKKGRYTAKTKQRIDLLKAPGLPQSQADKIRQQLHDFEAENENAIS